MTGQLYLVQFLEIAVCNAPEWCECHSDCNPTIQVVHSIMRTTHRVGSLPCWEVHVVSRASPLPCGSGLARET